MTTRRYKNLISTSKNDMTFNAMQAGKVQSLWRAVIMQAFVDVSSTAPNKRAICHKRKAAQWLCKKNTDDFVETCMLAGMEPSYVQMKADRAVKALTPHK